MEDSKTLQFYVVGLAGLITLSILFTGRIEPPETEPLLTTRVPTTAAVKPMARPVQVSQKGCPIANHKIMLYIPEMMTEDQRLVISGTVYAADLVTPLPGVLIEVSQTSPERQMNPRAPSSIFRDYNITDAVGHYDFTMVKPDRYNLIYLYYRARDLNYCPLTLQLFLVDEPALDDASTSLNFIKFDLSQVNASGPLLRGPVDIVLPVPPPEGKTTTN